MTKKLMSISYIFETGGIFWSVTICPHPFEVGMYQVFFYNVNHPENKIVAQCKFESGQPTIKNAEILLEQMLAGKIKNPIQTIN